MKFILKKDCKQLITPIAILVILAGVSAIGARDSKAEARMAEGYAEIIRYAKSDQTEIEENWNWHRAAVAYAFIRSTDTQLDLTHERKKWGSTRPGAWLIYQRLRRLDWEASAAFKKMTTVQLRLRQSTWAGETTNEYNGAAVAQLFNRLYRGPDARVGSQTTGELYRRYMQPYLRQNISMVAALLADDGWRADRIAEWIENEGIPMQKEMYGHVYTPQLYRLAIARLPDIPTGDPRLLGAIIRRAKDGSLKHLKPLLARFLKDYEPALYRQYSDSLNGYNRLPIM